MGALSWAVFPNPPPDTFTGIWKEDMELAALLVQLSSCSPSEPRSAVLVYCSKDQPPPAFLGEQIVTARFFSGCQEEEYQEHGCLIPFLDETSELESGLGSLKNTKFRLSQCLKFYSTGY